MKSAHPASTWVLGPNQAKMFVQSDGLANRKMFIYKIMFLPFGSFWEHHRILAESWRATAYPLSTGFWIPFGCKDRVLNKSLCRIRLRNSSLSPKFLLLSCSPQTGQELSIPGWLALQDLWHLLPAGDSDLQLETTWSMGFAFLESLGLGYALSFLGPQIVRKIGVDPPAVCREVMYGNVCKTPAWQMRLQDTYVFMCNFLSFTVNKFSHYATCPMCMHLYVFASVCNQHQIIKATLTKLLWFTGCAAGVILQRSDSTSTAAAAAKRGKEKQAPHGCWPITTRYASELGPWCLSNMYVYI